MNNKTQKSIFGYRPEIDGLRALAVITVILYHAGFEHFSGGFVGVDVFFVISGFLITSIIYHEQKLGIFSLAQFYERRARRILPTLFFIVFVCLPFAYLWMLPNQLLNFSQSIMAVVVFASNIFFWRTSGYFDIASSEKPLLHTWSLGVEEQFYLFFPIFMLLFGRFGFKKLVMSTVCLAILSLLLSQYECRYHTMSNFYLIPTRAWELLIGCILAYINFNIPLYNLVTKRYSNILATCGFVLISYSVFFFNKTVPYPSLFTLIPTIGAALIIGFAYKETYIGKLLSLKWIVGIGLISYSAYLWHQPLFAFSRIYQSNEPSKLVFALLSALSIFLAYLSWFLIEQPFRNKTRFTTRQIFIAPVVISIAFIGLGLSAYLSDGFQFRFEVPQNIVKSFAIPERSECLDIINAHKSDNWNCKINPKSENTQLDYVLFGDSHALQMLSAFEKASQYTGKNGVITGFSGCIPFLDTYPIIRDDQDSKDCYALNQRVFNYIKHNNIKNLFLVARWTYYTDGGYTGELRFINFIGSSKSTPTTLTATREAFETGLKKTIKKYGDLGVHLYIVNQIPAQLQEPQVIYYNVYSNSINREDALNWASVKHSQHIKLQSYVTSVFQKYINDSRVTFINFDNLLCINTICPIGTRFSSYYQDNNHLSKTGALRLSKPLANILENT